MILISTKKSRSSVLNHHAPVYISAGDGATLAPRQDALEQLTKILCNRAKQFPDILGIILLGSYVGSYAPKLCHFPKTKALSKESPKIISHFLDANLYPKKSKYPRDVDIWLLVKGSKFCPPLREIDKRQNEFFQAIATQNIVNARLVGELKKYYFHSFYKCAEYYIGFLSNEEEPWSGGTYTQAVLQDVECSKIYVPPVEIRAFPASVFHVRPHNIIDGSGYHDRSPMALDLASWLCPKSNFKVIYQTDQANIWPFVNTTPQGRLW